MVLNKYDFLTDGGVSRFCCGAKLLFLKSVVNRFCGTILFGGGVWGIQWKIRGIDMNFSGEFLDGSYISDASEKG